MLTSAPSPAKVVMRGDLRCGCLQGKRCPVRQLMLAPECSFLQQSLSVFPQWCLHLCSAVLPLYQVHTHTEYASEKEVILALFSRVNPIPAAFV